MPAGLRARRRALRLAALAFAGLLAGCGAQYKLPTEIARRAIPVDKSYQLLATWASDDQGRPLKDLQDILLTQGLVYTLFNHGGAGTAPRGGLVMYPLARPSAIPNDGFPTLFNPIALASGGDGAGRPRARLFVLDEGDSCLARANPITGQCNDTTGDWNMRVRDFLTTWRVREYGLYGGDTVSTFTDTTVAWVRGIAADAQGSIYVSCVAILLVANEQNPSILTRTYAPRIYRYLRGPRYPNVTPADWRMPGTQVWHRDTTWSVVDGSGLGFIQDAWGIEWGNGGDGPALYVTDYGRNGIQRMSDQQPSTATFQISDSGDPVLALYQPTDVAVDGKGFVYVCDTGNDRVMRHDPEGGYVQRVDIEVPATGPTAGQALQNPIAVTADDSLVYVADRSLNAIRRYKRRS